MTGPTTPLPVAYQTSPHSRSVALAFSLIFGVFGAHRFYTGRTGTGILQAVTLGGAGIWWLYDVILIASGNFRDNEGRRVLSWEPTDFDEPYTQLPAAVSAEISALRAELDEVHERLDFTERLLAQLPAGEKRP